VGKTIFIRRQFMSANLARRNRRVPVLSLLFLLFSTIISAVATPIYSVISVTWRIAESSFATLPSLVLSSLTHNAIVFSTLFLLVVVIMLLYKPKGWAFSIPAFIAFAFTSVIGIIYAIDAVRSLISYITGFVESGAFSFAELFSMTSISIFVSVVIRLMPLAIALCWFALGLSAIFSAVLHKTAKKGLRFSFGALTIAFGIIGSGMFIASAAANIAVLIIELLSRSVVGYAMLFCAPIFVFANILGFVGMILLVLYTVKPYKKGFQPEETDPEIIYAIDENDPVMNELDGTPTENVAEGELDEAAQAEEAERAAAYRQERAEEAAKAAAYRNEMQKAKARIKEQNEDAIREASVKKSKSRWTPIFTFSFITLLLSLIFEPGLLISTALGITGLIVMMCAKKKASIVVLGVLNMLFGGGIISLVAGILMMFIPEDTLL